jgi:hypothetical protein
VFAVGEIFNKLRKKKNSLLPEIIKNTMKVIFLPSLVILEKYLKVNYL